MLSPPPYKHTESQIGACSTITLQKKNYILFESLISDPRHVIKGCLEYEMQDVPTCNVEMQEWPCQPYLEPTLRWKG